MRGLTVIVAGAEPPRLRSALELAATHAALGGRARLFLQAPAVPLLAPPHAAAVDLAADGMPSLAELVETALTLGTEIILCQTGLAIASLDLGALDPRLTGGGLTGLLATLGGDRLVGL